jgi:hypothetical protein
MECLAGAVVTFCDFDQLRILLSDSLRNLSRLILGCFDNGIHVVLSHMQNKVSPQHPRCPPLNIHGITMSPLRRGTRMFTVTDLALVHA